MISVRVNEIFNYLSSDHKKVSPVTENACDIGFRMWFVKRIIDSQVMPALKSSLLFPEILFSRVFQIMKVRYPTKFAVFVAFVPAILRPLLLCWEFTLNRNCCWFACTPAWHTLWLCAGDAQYSAACSSCWIILWLCLHVGHPTCNK